MDKELLALLIRHLSEQELIALYKIKKINNFGFRANTPEDIKKNRDILEKNLLKIPNFKILTKNFMTSSSDIDINDINSENFKEYTNRYGLLKLSPAFLIQNKTDLLKGHLNNLNIVLDRDHIHNSVELNQKNESDSKLQKILKKLELKITNLNEELNKRDKQIEEKTNELNSLKLEKNKLNNLLNKSIQKNETLISEKNQLITENVKLEQDYNELNEKLNEKQLQMDILQEQLKNVTEVINYTESHLQSNSVIDIETESEHLLISKIAVIGEYTKIIPEQLPTYDFTFYEMNLINELKDNLDKFQCLWIINYDLTQKEQKLITRILKNEFDNINTHNIFSLKDLNILLSTYK